MCERAFRVKGQQSGSDGSLSLSLAAAAAAQANTPTRRAIVFPLLRNSPAPRRRVQRLSYFSAPCPSPPDLRHVRKATPLAQPRRVSTAPPAPRPRRIGLRTRNPLASREAGRKGTHCSRENVHGLHFPTGHASRCPRRPGEPPWTTFPDRPLEPLRAAADSASRRAARGAGAAGRGRADAGSPDVRHERRPPPARSRPAASPSEGRAALGLARRPPWR